MELEQDKQQVSSLALPPADTYTGGDSDIFDLLITSPEEPVADPLLLAGQGKATQAAATGSAADWEPERPLDEPPQLVLAELAGK